MCRLFLIHYLRYSEYHRQTVEIPLLESYMCHQFIHERSEIDTKKVMCNVLISHLETGVDVYSTPRILFNTHLLRI